MNYIRLLQSQKTLAIALALVGVYNAQASLGSEPSSLSTSNLPASLTDQHKVLTSPNLSQWAKATVASKQNISLLAEGARIYAQEEDRGRPENRIGGGSYAQEEDRGRPVVRRGGGSYFRSPAPPEQELSGQRMFTGTRVRGLLPLTALVPVIEETSGDTQSQSVIGLTTEQYPTFWFYVPYKITANNKLEFVLEDEKGNQVYQTSFTPLASTPGVIGVKLPSTAAPLEVGKPYRWYFKTYLNENSALAVNGWVQRVSLNESLKKKLGQSQAGEKPAIYAAEGIWFDALTNLVQLRRNNPENIIFKAEWNRLLKDVDLEAVAQEPLTNCCDSTQ
ncbi:MAG: DUF928 domain-containing protein [Coleofasciculaceae cyanobacterium]